MDEQTREKINDLVAEFQSARTPADRQRVTLRAQRELMFVEGALREFVDRASAIGDVRLIPQDLLGSYEEQQEQRAGSEADVDALVDDLIARYEQAGSVRERNEVLLDASEQLAGFPVQSRRFNAAVGAMPDFEPRSETTAPPEETTQSTVDQPQTPVSRFSRSRQETTQRSLETPPGEISEQTRQRERNPAASNETRRRERSENITDRETQSYLEDRYGGDPAKIAAAIQASLRERILLQRLGITGEDALQIIAYYRNRGLDLASEIQNFRAQGGTDQDARDFFYDISQGVSRQILAEPVPPAAVNRLVQMVDEDGNPVGEPRMSQTPGIVQASDLTLRRNADGSLYVYPASMPSLFLQELSVSGLASFKERLYEYFGTDMTNPMAVEQQTAIVLQEANRTGKDLELLFADYDRAAGVQLDATGRRQPMLTGPIEYTPTDQIVAVAEQIAVEELGRELTAAEKAGIVNEYKMIERDFAFERRRAEIKSATGAVAEIDRQPLSVDTAVDRWLRENRPEQMRVADEMPHYEALFDMWQNGDFNV